MALRLVACLNQVSEYCIRNPPPVHAAVTCAVLQKLMITVLLLAMMPSLCTILHSCAGMHLILLA